MKSVNGYDELNKKQRERKRGVLNVVQLEKCKAFFTSYLTFIQNEDDGYNYDVTLENGNVLIVNETKSRHHCRDMITEYKSMGFKVTFEGILKDFKPQK